MTHSKNQAVTSNGSDRVWESTIINEYLDEVFPEPPLMPSERGERAIALLLYSKHQDTEGNILPR
ncbi:MULTISPECIES: glutathione S-transferase family protein [Cyanophyceae]|uniref:glutathione S-transferase family protein n=1 Tax=Cyanophyceae TaxID=3028117 RepID=UPI0018F00FD9|nr:glutathione S-transferase family protein [Trichocoleus sp. FACHB-40]